MYSSSDFEHLFIRYKAEGVPQGESIQSFCMRNKVPYNLFHKWYKDTRHSIVPVHVEGQPVEEPENPSSPAVQPEESGMGSGSVRIMIDIRVSNGMHIRQRNLSYQNQRSLVEKQEILC